MKKNKLPDTNKETTQSFFSDLENVSDLELELKQTLEQCTEHNSRLINFSHIVSHNLKTHYGNINMLLDMIDEEENEANKKEFFGYLRTVSNDLNQTLGHLSEIVSIQNNINIITEPLDLNNYLEKNSKIINAYGLKKRATIINKVPKGSIINFNSSYLESILLNFSTNSIKYAHPNRFPKIIFEFYVENNKKILTIKDNGLGIDLQKHGELLFGMYKTFHKHDDSNGIGLYITKNQIESLKGQISVDSTLGEGTTFKITFND